MAFNKPTGASLSEVWAAGGATTTILTAKMDLGWVDEIPSYQNMNYLQNLFSAFIANTNERGIPSWDSTTTYMSRALVKGSNETLYVAMVGQAGNDPTTDAGTNWKPYVSNNLTDTETYRALSAAQGKALEDTKPSKGSNEDITGVWNFTASQIIHDREGSSSGVQNHIRNDTNGMYIGLSSSEHLEICQANASGIFEEYWLRGFRNGALTLYHNGNAKMNTEDYGVQVDGQVRINNTVDPEPAIYILNSSDDIAVDSGEDLTIGHWNGSTFTQRMEMKPDGDFVYGLNRTTNLPNCYITMVAPSGKAALGIYSPYTGNSDVFRVYSNEGSGSENQVYEIQADGTAGIPSDESVKENIVDAPSLLEEFKSLRFVNYNLIGGSGTTKFGVIAQEVEEVDKFSDLVLQPTENRDIHFLDYQNLAVRYGKVIQELIARVEALENAQ